MAAVVLFGIVHAGGRYFYCEAHGLRLSDPCAQAPGAGSTECPGSAADAEREDCCLRLVLRAMPDSVGGARSRIAAAPIAALLPAVAEIQANVAADPSPRADHLRWRVPPRAAGEQRAKLMVYVI